MQVHPLVKIAAQFAGAVGGAALVGALIGTTVVVSTSWFTIVIAWLVYAALLLAGAYAGQAAAARLCDAVSEDAFGRLGTKLGGWYRAARGA